MKLATFELTTNQKNHANIAIKSAKFPSNFIVQIEEIRDITCSKPFAILVTCEDKFENEMIELAKMQKYK